MKYSVCEETGLRVCEVYEHLLVREDGMVKNISGHHLAKKDWHSGNKSGSLNRQSYRSIKIPGTKDMSLVHRAVAIAFIPNPNNYPQINHINHTESDNRVINLEWCNTRQNCTMRKSNNVLVGASYNKNANKWQSQIQVNKKPIYLGLFKTELEAHQAYIQYKADHNII